ncbi:uncharacterized protein LOC119662335 [Teleopsis dalmanni]|uniref:uncharacterized protein LOC119662335 n=1 Tax=Teleopsis dalmanni TaxID=139649 RepID=UPI0018CCFA87|nr:uncharacterized protein LOC119662335 [Teleopsis dalmanni]
MKNLATLEIKKLFKLPPYFTDENVRMFVVQYMNKALEMWSKRRKRSPHIVSLLTDMSCLIHEFESEECYCSFYLFMFFLRLNEDEAEKTHMRFKKASENVMNFCLDKLDAGFCLCDIYYEEGDNFQNENGEHEEFFLIAVDESLEQINIPDENNLKNYKGDQYEPENDLQQHLNILLESDMDE